MSQVFNKLYIDVRTKTQDIITAVQKDSNSRFLDVFLLDNGLPIDLTGHEVRLYGKKYDSTEIYNDGTITEPIKGRCEFPLTDQALAAAQDLIVQIVIYYNNVEVLQTLPFTISVAVSLISDSAIESSNEYGSLVVLFQKLYEAKDLMTDMVQAFGTKGQISVDRNINTYWQAVEYVAKYLDVDIRTLLEEVLQEASVQGVINRLGETTDTGATATAGTVFGKLNNIISGTKFKAYKHFQMLVSPNSSERIILSVAGTGEFYGIYAQCLTNIKVVVDGVEFSNIGSTSETKIYRTTFEYQDSTIKGLRAFDPSSNYYYGLTDCVPFKNSLVIKVTNSHDTYSYQATVGYSLYE